MLNTKACNWDFRPEDFNLLENLQPQFLQDLPYETNYDFSDMNGNLMHIYDTPEMSTNFIATGETPYLHSLSDDFSQNFEFANFQPKVF